MNKNDMIQRLRLINPLRTMKSWQRTSKKEIQGMYDEAIKVGVLK